MSQENTKKYANKEDINLIDFARAISMLTTQTPLSVEFDRIYGQKERVWYGSQREHLTGWCLNYPYGGVKGFKHEPSDSFLKMYRSYSRPETLLWVAEALGESSDLLKNIMNEIKDVKCPKIQCTILRKFIPAERIVELLKDRGLLEPMPFKRELVMIVFRAVAIPSLEIGSDDQYHNGMAVFSDGTAVSIDEEYKDRLLDDLDRYYVRSTGYPMATYAYVSWRYAEEFISRMGRGKTYYSILNDCARSMKATYQKLWLDKE